jgi:hypothetical protein
MVLKEFTVICRKEHIIKLLSVYEQLPDIGDFVAAKRD